MKYILKTTIWIGTKEKLCIKNGTEIEQWANISHWQILFGGRMSSIVLFGVKKNLIYLVFLILSMNDIDKWSNSLSNYKRAHWITTKLKLSY